MPIQLCSVCGQTFEARDYGGPAQPRYCGGACRQKAFQRRRDDRLIAMGRRDALEQQARRGRR